MYAYAIQKLITSDNLKHIYLIVTLISGDASF